MPGEVAPGASGPDVLAAKGEPEQGGAVAPAGPAAGCGERRHGAPRLVNPVSVLFPDSAQGARGEGSGPPEFFRDLQLDRVVQAITASREEYDLEPFFYQILPDVNAIEYRHEVFRDVEELGMSQLIGSFAGRFRTMRQYLGRAEKSYYELQKARWFLDAVAIYCEAVTSLTEDLRALRLKSRGLVALREYLCAHVGSEAFTALRSEAVGLLADLDAVTYALLVKGTRITVRPYQGEADYSAEVAETFRKFRQGEVKDYTVALPTWLEMNHVEARVLDFVAALNTETFSRLRDFPVRHAGYLDPVIGAFDREIQWYVACLDYIAGLRPSGLRFCYPRVTRDSKEVCATQCFDVALAQTLAAQRGTPVCNDFLLAGRERILVVSGPNQGGKSTFARMFGQVHYLASIGCLVPGRDARLFLFDRMFTHFERTEDIANLRGKLEDDLVRSRRILAEATPNSIIIMNEIFSSTTLEDARTLGERILRRIIDLDALCVYVTFVDDLSRLAEQTVSVVSTVEPDDPATRTFRIVRRPSDGAAYAATIAERYGLTYAGIRDRLRERLTS